jgi:hypothetical protein
MRSKIVIIGRRLCVDDAARPPRTLGVQIIRESDFAP